MEAIRSQGTITRRVETVLNELEEEFKTIHCRSDFERKIEALKAVGDSSARPSKLAVLYRMFDACGIEYERDRENAYYEKLVREASRSSIYDMEDMGDRMVYALYKRYDIYPSPEEYMKKIVDKIKEDQPQDQAWEEESLRIRILKQFVKYGGYLEEAGYKSRATIEKYAARKAHRVKKDMSIEETAKYLDDDIFICLLEATKEEKKPNRKYGLLKLADDLAAGKFRTQGATKKGLYLFAMAYGLCFYSGSPMDIEKNLFRDYYSNNLMRFISEEYRGRAGEYENPSGQGINYKNFAEMIYLYYISKDCYSPKEKIRLSSAMIKRVQKSQFGQKKEEEKGTRRQTRYYKGHFVYDEEMEELFSEDVLGLSEEEFEAFICEHYECDTSAASYKTSPLLLESEQNTAYAEYQDIVRKLEAINGQTAEENTEHGNRLKEDKKRTLGEYNYGLWFVDTEAYKKGMNSLQDRYEDDIDREKFAEFMELLSGVDSFLKNMIKEVIVDKSSDVKISTLAVESAKDVTRTSLLVVYYYYFNAYHEKDGREELRQLAGFGELFRRFKSEIDPILERCGYQKIDGKNIFDVSVIFSSYAYLFL